MVSFVHSAPRHMVGQLIYILHVYVFMPSIEAQ